MHIHIYTNICVYTIVVMMSGIANTCFEYEWSLLSWNSVSCSVFVKWHPFVKLTGSVQNNQSLTSH